MFCVVKCDCAFWELFSGPDNRLEGHNSPRFVQGHTGRKILDFNLLICEIGAIMYTSLSLGEENDPINTKPWGLHKDASEMLTLNLGVFGEG